MKLPSVNYFGQIQDGGVQDGCLELKMEILATTTKAASVRKQLGMKNSKSREGRQEKNGGVKGRDGSSEELDRETGEEDT